MSKFLKGTMILLIAGLFTRILGFINRIVVARMIGEEGVGLYMMAYPTFILVVTLTQFGLPVAISKRVAEAEAIGNTRKVKKILAISLITTLTLSIIFTPLLFFGAPLLAGTVFTDERTIFPLLAIAPVIPVVAVSSVIRGYFQGKQNMKPAAIQQIIEQVVRIGLIVVLTKYFLPFGIEYAAAAVMLATIGGETIALFYLLTMFKIKKAFPLRKNFLSSLKNTKSIFRELLNISLPTTGSRMIGSLSWFVEPIVVTHSLAIAGVTTTLATKQYGSLTGFALPLLLLPSFITVALSTSLVPAISEAYSLKKFALVERRIQQALRLCILTGAISVIVIYTLAEPLMQAMYNSSSGAIFIQIMAPFIIFQYLQAPLQATLQALDLAKAAMINSFIGAVVKTATIFILASQPDFGINGVALGFIIGFVLVAFLHYATIMKVIPLTFYARFYVKILIVTIAIGFAGKYLFALFIQQYPNFIAISLTSCVMVLLYIIGLTLFKVISLKDIRKLFMFLQPIKR
ncbi:stage V sporulation protein B [Bacillus kwashiorkori]|uniref:stage V sporulation protein B n=1 Tax=Bacillus kwashiorkori TaxID=1522318 RepID=UPI000784129F|nr:stage V sporulation protein B [Bacillus kwashiorkori]